MVIIFLCLFFLNYPFVNIFILLFRYFVILCFILWVFVWFPSMRGFQSDQLQDLPSSSDQQPINAAYYAPMAGAYNTGYNTQGYDNAGFFDNYSAHYYGGPETTYTGGGATSGYRGFPQPQPSPQQPYRRSRFVK